MPAQISGGGGLRKVSCAGGITGDGTVANPITVASSSRIYDVTAAPYNATGDGVTDDTAAIQAAVDAANSAGGGTVYLPNGTYIISEFDPPSAYCLNIPSNVVLEGESQVGVELKAAAAGLGSSCRPLRVMDANDVVIRRLSINGTKADQDVDEHRAAIFLWTTNRVLIEDVTLHDNCGDGIHIYIADNTVIRRVHSYDNDRKSISITGGPCNHMFVGECYFPGDTNGGLHIESEAACTNLWFENTYIGNPVVYDAYPVSIGGVSDKVYLRGLEIHGGLQIGVNAKRIRVSNCYIEAGTQIAGAPPLTIQFDVDDCIVEGCVIYQSDEQGSQDNCIRIQGAYSFGPGPERPRNIIIRNNMISTEYQSATGITLINTGSVLIEGNNFVHFHTDNLRAAVALSATDATFSPTIDTTIVRGNHTSGFYYGVQAGANAGDKVISSLAIQDNVVEKGAIATAYGWHLAAYYDVVQQLAMSGNELIGCSAYVGVDPVTTNTPFVTYPACPILIGGERGGGGSYLCSGTPESVITESVGARAVRRDSTGGTVEYIKASGDDTSTGWVPVGGVVATGSITCVAQASMADSDYMTISDGLRAPVVYEFDVAGDGVTGGRVQVNISGSSTATDVATLLKAAIETNQPGIGVTQASGVLTLAHKIAGTFANVTITENVANGGFSVTGMTGGVNPAR